MMTASRARFETATTTATVPPPNDYERALQRERLDASILRSLGERRAHRAHRVNDSSSAWDGLERQVMRASTLLWEIAEAPFTLCEDLLAYCAFLARELEVTESMDLGFDDEWDRLQSIAPRAIATLDEISGELGDPEAESNPVTRALADVFGAIRAEFVAATQFAWANAA